MTLLLGNESFSGANTESMNPDRLRWYTFVASASGLASVVRVTFSNAFVGQGIKFAIYTNDASLSLIAQTAPATVTSETEQDFPLVSPVSITQGETFRLAVLSSAGHIFEASADSIQRLEPVTDLWDYSDPFPADLTGESGGGTTRSTPAIRVLQTGATLTVSGDLQPGASFTLNYSNYDAVPVSPATMTDSAGNSITVPVTISDSVNGTTGKHEGTATGTMPALPSSGSIAGLKFGTVNVSLSSA